MFTFLRSKYTILGCAGTFALGGSCKQRWRNPIRYYFGWCQRRYIGGSAKRRWMGYKQTENAHAWGFGYLLATGEPHWMGLLAKQLQRWTTYRSSRRSTVDWASKHTPPLRNSLILIRGKLLDSSPRNFAKGAYTIWCYLAWQYSSRGLDINRTAIKTRILY